MRLKAGAGATLTPFRSRGVGDPVHAEHSTHIPRCWGLKAAMLMARHGVCWNRHHALFPASDEPLALVLNVLSWLHTMCAV